MKTKTREEVIAVQAAWMERISEIRENWDVTLAAEGFCLQSLVAMVGLIGA
jgi:hypothetical protein